MDYRIKDLPNSERPREKLKENGVESLSDAELLSLVLRTGIKGKNVKELSADILSSYSLKQIANVPLEMLLEFDGVSEVKAGQLKAIGELGLRMNRQTGEKIESLSDLKDEVRDMELLETEKFRAFFISSGNEVLGRYDIDGSVNSVSADTREVFQEALNRNAAATIVAHNHPSGRSEPTPEDISVTEKMIDAGKLLGVELLDHVIVGEDIRSMRKENDLEFRP